MSITCIAKQAAETKFQKDIQSRRQAQRTIYFNEYMKPVAEAFMERLKNELAPLKVNDDKLYLGGGVMHQVGVSIVEGFSSLMHFGIAYNVEKGVLHLCFHNFAWGGNSFPQGTHYVLPMEWQDWDEEKFIALLRKAWNFVNANYSKDRVFDQRNWWKDNGFDKEVQGW